MPPYRNDLWARTMRIVFITQDDPFYLGESFESLLSNLPAGVTPAAGCILNFTPYNKNESLLKKIGRTCKVFGVVFLAQYLLRYAKSIVCARYRVRRVFARHGIPVIEVSGNINSPDFIRQLKGARPDLIVSVAANVIFRKELIAAAPLGCLNVHTALLPKYRGLMPTFWVLKNNEKLTGVSVFFVDEKIDNGPILVQKKVEIRNQTWDELIRETKRVGMQAVAEAIVKIQAGHWAPIANDSAEGTYYSMPTRQDVLEFLARGKRFF